MFCQNCGNKIEPGEQFCRSCGAKIEHRAEPTVMAEPAHTAHAEPVPVRTVYVQAPPAEPAAPKTNDMAIVGFVMAFVMPLIGLIFSIIGLKNAKNGASNRGLALAGVIISALYVVSGVLVGLIYVFYFFFIFWVIGASSTYSVILPALGSLLII